MIGPDSALLVVLALGFLSRWVFSVKKRERRMAAERAERDFGVLVPVTTATDPDEAARQRDLLVAHGLRATVGRAVGPDHGEPVRVTASGHLLPHQGGVVGTHVLVFPDDREQARQLLGI